MFRRVLVKALLYLCWTGQRVVVRDGTPVSVRVKLSASLLTCERDLEQMQPLLCVYKETPGPMSVQC